MSIPDFCRQSVHPLMRAYMSSWSMSSWSSDHTAMGVRLDDGRYFMGYSKTTGRCRFGSQLSCAQLYNVSPHMNWICLFLTAKGYSFSLVVLHAD